MFQQITSLFKTQQGGVLHSRVIRTNNQKTLKALAFLSCVIFFVFLPLGFSEVSKAEAATYYVDATNGNNSYNGTSPSFTGGSNGPYQTLSAVGGNLGDITKLKRGETWSNQSIIVNANNITVTSYYNSDGSDDLTQAKPYINNDGVGKVRAIQVNGKTGVTISNIKASGDAGSDFQFLNADGLNILNLDSISPTGQCYSFYASTANWSATATNSTCTGAAGSGGWYIYDNGSYSVLLTATNCSSSNHTVLSGWNFSNNARGILNNCSANNNYIDGFSVNNSSVATCDHCSSYNNGVSARTDSGDGYTAHDTATFNIYGSIGYGNLKSCVGMVNNTTGVLYNNTCYNNELGGSAQGELYITSSQAWTAKNNIFFATPAGYATMVSGSGTRVIENNLYYGKFSWSSADKTFVQWLAATNEIGSLSADALFVSTTTPDFYILYNSPAIDSGTPISGITTDYLGNHIYGTPDIGAYEYQPPYTITIDNPNISSPIRIYADGKYRYTTTTSGSSVAKLSITPQTGFGTGDYSQWMDVAIDTWHTSTDYYKKWTEASANPTLTTNHTIGDLEPSIYYTLKLDSVNQDTYLSNSSGQITFTYSGGYSTHTFEITEDTTPPASFTLISPTTNTTTSNRTPTFSWNPSSDTESNLSKYQFYLDGIIETDNISNATTSILPTNILSCGNHSWYIKAIDNNNNTTNSNTFNLDINCAGAFISSPKPIVTPTDPTLGTVPSNITQIAISRTPDFTNISWQPFDKDKFKNIDQTTETLYVKFRTDQGAVSDTIIYTPQASNQSTAITLNEGDIVKTLNNPDVYVIKYKNNKQYKRLILSPLVFKSYGHLKWENIKTISQEQLDKYTTSNLVKETIDTIIYQLFPNGDIGERKAQDTSINYDPDSVYEINAVDRDSYVLTK